MTMPNIGRAPDSVSVGQLADVMEARELAERMGYASFRTRATMPPEFAGVPVLSEGFAEGLLNARCEYEQVRAGLL